jgi:hypothetical protein
MAGFGHGGGAASDSGDPPTAHARCAELLEHRQRVAYPSGKATRKGALWEGGSMRGGGNLPAVLAFMEESNEEVN